jgi:hypothetical protein
MTNLRNALIALPFTREERDGTLNLWSVTPSGDRFYDVPTGRSFCAWFMHVVRQYDAAHMLAHVAYAFGCHPERESASGILEGWAEEFGEALASVKPCCPGVMLVSGVHFGGQANAHEARLALPFVTERADGTLNCFDVDVHEAGEKGAARGRHYAALTAKYIMDTGDSEFYAALCADYPCADSYAPVALAFCTAIAEIVASCSLTATAHQKAARVFFEEAASDEMALNAGR